jgi:lysophospholipase L1-like esterase
MATLRLMTVGDSITADGRWQQEFARLAAAYAGVTVDVRNVAVAGQRTTYWPDRIAGLLVQHQPDVVSLFSGTNDDPAEQRFGEPATGWAWRYTVEAIRAYRQANPAWIVPAFIQYSDPWSSAPEWLLRNEPLVNDIIYRQYKRREPDGWFAGICNFQQIPGTADYLAEEITADYPTGIAIHPNARGQRAMGRITYDAVHVALGWPPCPEPPLRGMYGHRRGYPRPPYLPWPDACSCGGAQ